jgi:hypothetical protein
VELAVVNTAENYVFMYPLFFKRLGKKWSTVRARQVPQAVKASRHPMGMHLVTCQACAQKSGYTSYNSVFVSTLWLGSQPSLCEKTFSASFVHQPAENNTFQYTHYSRFNHSVRISLSACAFYWLLTLMQKAWCIS